MIYKANSVTQWDSYLLLEKNFFNGSGYSFLNIGFGIKPHKEYEHIIKETEFEFPQRIELFAGQPISNAAYSLQHADKLFYF